MAERLTTGRFFMERVLPAAATHLARIKAGPPRPWNCRPRLSSYSTECSMRLQ